MFEQNVLNNYIKEVKTKYKGIVQDLNLEALSDQDGDYINLILIEIKRNRRNQGYGSVILSGIVRLADEYNVRITLWPTDVFGANMKRLRTFYRRHGFVLNKTSKEEGGMIYRPKKKFRRVVT
jgi:GNAT superfamily N-acetyltransferase